MSPAAAKHSRVDLKSVFMLRILIKPVCGNFKIRNVILATSARARARDIVF